MTVRTDSWPVTVAFGDQGTSARISSIPGGCLGWVEVTTNQTGITTATDLSGLSLAITAATARLLKITAKVPVSSATADDRVGISIKEGSTVLSGDQTTLAQVSLPYTLLAVAVVEFTAGSHTYKVSLGISGGATGPIRTDHVSNGRSLLLVEDMGPVF